MLFHDKNNNFFAKLLSHSKKLCTFASANPKEPGRQGQARCTRAFIGARGEMHHRCPGGGMVDALVSGASGESRAGSSPVLGTPKRPLIDCLSVISGFLVSKLDYRLTTAPKFRISGNFGACVDVGTRGSALSAVRHVQVRSQRASARPYIATNPCTGFIRWSL